MSQFVLTTNKNRSETTRRLEIHKLIDFALVNGATGMIANDTLSIGVHFPINFVHESVRAFLVSAEGAAATVDVGTAAQPTGFLHGVSINGTAGDARIAPAGDEPILSGTFVSDTDVLVTAHAAVKAAKLRLVFLGFTVDR